MVVVEVVLGVALLVDGIPMEAVTYGIHCLLRRELTRGIIRQHSKLLGRSMESIQSY
jgi:hypothetical protein